MQLGMVGQSYEYSIIEMFCVVVNDLEVRQVGDVVFIFIGLVDVDYLLGGLYDFDLVVIVVCLVMGKMVFLLNFILNSEVFCGLIFIEQLVIQVGQCLIFCEGCFVVVWMCSFSDISDVYWVVIMVMVKKFQDCNNIWINDNCGLIVVDVVC